MTNALSTFAGLDCLNPDTERGYFMFWLLILGFCFFFVWLLVGVFSVIYLLRKTFNESRKRNLIFFTISQLLLFFGLYGGTKLANNKRIPLELDACSTLPETSGIGILLGVFVLIFAILSVVYGLAYLLPTERKKQSNIK